MDTQGRGPQAVQVRMLGRFRITVAELEIKLETRKAESLFAFLALHQDRPTSRDKITGAIWPDWEEDRARANLNTALWRIRKTLRAVPGITIEATRDAIYLRLDEWVEVDVVRVRHAVDAARARSTANKVVLLAEGETLQAGEFLEGILDEWCDEERRECHHLHVETLRMLIEESDGEDLRVIGYLEKLIALEPLDEKAHRDLMRIHYLQGNRALALRQYDRLKDVLQRELGVEPNKATMSLWGQISEQPEIGKRIDTESPGKVAAGSDSVFDVPLVGRKDALTALVGALTDASKGMGSVQLVKGDIGIGKTKLAEAIAKEGRIRGFDVLTGSCCDPDSGLPYQAIIQALWPRISDQQAASTWSSPIIDRLVRTLMPEAPATPGGRSFLPSSDSALVNECLASLLLGSADSGPTLLILEDLHHVERATEGLLNLLLGRVTGKHLAILGTMRSEPQSERIARQFISSGANEIELGPLTQSEVSDLVKLALRTSLVSEQLVHFVADRSSGVPLFALELLKFLAAEDCLTRNSKGRLSVDEGMVRAKVPRVPFGVAEVIRRRIRLVGTEASSILSAAAVLGPEVSYDLLEEFIGIPEDQFIGNVERLVEARLLHETEKGLKFPHEATRSAGLTLLSAARLRKLHAKAAALLERISPSKSEDIAFHWDQAGECSRAFCFYEISGDRARAVYANDDASRWYSRSLDTMAKINDSDRDTEILRRRALLLIKRQEVLDLLGRRAEQSEDVDAILFIAERLDDRRLAAEGELLRSQVLSRLNSNSDALTSAHRAAALFRIGSDMRGQARAHESCGTAHMNSRNHSGARQAFRTALFLYRRAKDRSGEARCLVSLGTLSSFDGKILQGMEYLDGAERILNEIRDRRSLAGALLQKGVLYRFLGMNNRSKVYLRNGIAAMEEIGDRIGHARGRSQMAFTYIALGELREAVRESLAALRIAREARDIRAQIVFLNNIAYGAYRSVGEFGRATRAVLEAIRLATQARGVENIATYYDTMAAILLDQGNHDEALRWAKQAHVLYRAWEGRFNYVGADIALRLGIAYMCRAEYSRARPLLLRALDYWKRGGDLELQPHGVAALGLLYLEQGDLDHALECARDLERLMRKVDGIEQKQGVYWAQYRIFRRMGMDAAARRALNRAYESVCHQAASLKGRLRRMFVAVRTNKDIIDEIRRFGIRAGVNDQANMVSVAKTTQPEPARTKGLRVVERRRALLMLMAKSATGQNELARHLGVSPRTIRHDLSVLRSQGFVRELFPRHVEA